MGGNSTALDGKTSLFQLELMLQREHHLSSIIETRLSGVSGIFLISNSLLTARSICSSRWLEALGFAVGTGTEVRGSAHEGRGLNVKWAWCGMAANLAGGSQV